MPFNLNAFEYFPVLKTRRLLLRSLVQEDCSSILAMRRQKATNRFIARGEASDESVNEVLEKVKKAYSEKQGIAWGAVIQGRNNIIGTCGFNRIDHMNHRAELGGEMSPAFWGRGLALEAVEAIVQYGFKEFGLHSVEAWVWPNNRGAIQLLETIGFNKEAHFKDTLFFNEQYLDMAVYSILK